MNVYYLFHLVQASLNDKIELITDQFKDVDKTMLDKIYKASKQLSDLCGQEIQRRRRDEEEVEDSTAHYAKKIFPRKEIKRRRTDAQISQEANCN